MKANGCGFYAIQGKSMLKFLYSSKADDITEVMEEIRKKNRKFKVIIIILDNARVHSADKVKKKCEKLGIYLVPLPVYSPDLNPIEFIWKSIKRVLSITFIRNEYHLKKIIKESFDKYANSMSYAKDWILKILVPIFNKNKIVARKFKMLCK